ncbi:MAG TPA: hypothetical protein VNT81_11915 [Vicinamibacterales bacterium]|nr:hypothetical protein [Vicinamibacterales bacterium]
MRWVGLGIGGVAIAGIMWLSWARVADAPATDTEELKAYVKTIAGTLNDLNYDMEKGALGWEIEEASVEVSQTSIAQQTAQGQASFESLLGQVTSATSGTPSAQLTVMVGDQDGRTLNIKLKKVKPETAETSQNASPGLVPPKA